MITKERLEELIEQGATIWTKDLHFLELNKNDCFMNSKNLLQFGNFHYTNDYLFETEEDARWELEMTVTRTETLKLPSWEEFVKDRELEEFGFYSKYQKYTVIRVINEKYLVVETSFERYYTGELTKENYIEACKLCLRLFKGE